MKKIHLLIQEDLDPETKQLLSEVKRTGVSVEMFTVPKSATDFPYPIAHFHRPDGKVSEYGREAVNILLKNILSNRI